MLKLLPVIALTLPVAAFAGDKVPPADALALSKVIATLESSVGADLAYVDQIDWDDDGYWEVEYKTRAGAKVEVKIDPLTGQSLSR
ncbi:PepSY domain-containing protein [Paracoccus sp. p4-l81]|uniref:PepSY domain-containing protein n=1 Tax=unclassified Paracoccus (in: a-proteobacteria) TaxID=2688777 RepID=UPI0035BA1F8A